MISNSKKSELIRYNTIISSNFGDNCEIICIHLLKNRKIGKRIKTKITLTLQGKCGKTRTIDSQSLTTNRRTLDINNGFNLCDNPLGICSDCDEDSFAEVSIDYQHDRNEYPRGGIWNEKNNGPARQVKKTSSELYSFTCVNPLCKHPYKMTPSKIVNEKRGCMYCSKGSKNLCGSKDCNVCVNKSLLSTRPNIMEVWSSKNEVPPYAIMKTSSIDIFLDCPGCKESYKRNIRTINFTCNLMCKTCKDKSIIRQEITCEECYSKFMRTTDGETQCQCCKGVNIQSIPLCKKDNCDKCFNRSAKKRQIDEGFGSLIFLEVQNNCTLRDISRMSGREYQFHCDLCEETISIKFHKKAINCPNCSPKFTTEEYVRKLLYKITNKYFIKTRTLSWLIDNTNNNHLELDGYNDELKVAFEYQGEQHYILTFLNQHNNENLENTKRKDKLKLKLCHENGVKLIVVPYWYPHTSVEQFLREYIQ